MMASRSDNISVVTGMVSPATCTEPTVGSVGMLKEKRIGTLGTAARGISCRWSGEATDSKLSWDGSFTNYLLELRVDRVCMTVLSIPTNGAKCWDRKSQVLTGHRVSADCPTGW